MPGRKAPENGDVVLGTDRMPGRLCVFTATL